MTTTSFAPTALSMKAKWGLFLVAVVIFLLMVAYFWDYSMDDAFITFRYAENLAESHGLVFNPSDKPVEGYSNFLWLLLLSLVHLVGLPIYLSAKIIGVVSLLLTALVWFRHYEKRNSSAWLAAPLFLVAPITAFWAVSGLELGLHSLLIIIAVVLAERNSKWLNLVLPLIVISRPEGALVCLGIVLARALADRAAGRPFAKNAITSGSVIIVTALALTAFRLYVFGYPLPNTFYAKTHGSPLPGFIETGRMLLYFAPLTVGLVWGIRKVLVSRFADSSLAIWVVPVAVQLVVSSSVNPVMNILFRYLTPFLPLLLAITLTAVGGIARTGYRRLALVLVLLSLFSVVPETLARLADNERMVGAQEAFIKWARQLPPDATIAMTDMGRIPFYTGLHYYDLWGLTDEYTAHHGQDVPREIMRLPDYFVLVGYLGPEECELNFGHERILAWTNYFTPCYRYLTICTPKGADPFKPGYNYLVFKRTPGARAILGL